MRNIFACLTIFLVSCGQAVRKSDVVFPGEVIRFYASSKNPVFSGTPWTKYPSNPMMGDNKSSGILVDAGLQYRLYTIYPQAAVHFGDQNH